MVKMVWQKLLIAGIVFERVCIKSTIVIIGTGSLYHLLLFMVMMKAPLYSHTKYGF